LFGNSQVPVKNNGGGKEIIGPKKSGGFFRKRFWLRELAVSG